MINITKIYLITNIDNDPNKVYIGKTKNTSRESDHKYKFGNQITFDYIDEVNSLNKQEWEPIETYWIEQFRQWGFIVINKNKGGGGPGSHSIISRLKISTSKIGQKYNVLKGRIHGSKDKPKSKEHCSSISLSKKGKPNLKNRIPKPIGFGETNFKPILQYDLKDNFIKEWKSLTEATKFLGYKTPPGSLSYNLKGKYKSALGFKWKYKY